MISKLFNIGNREKIKGKKTPVDLFIESIRRRKLRFDREVFNKYYNRPVEIISFKSLPDQVQEYFEFRRKQWLFPEYVSNSSENDWHAVLRIENGNQDYTYVGVETKTVLDNRYDEKGKVVGSLVRELQEMIYIYDLIDGKNAGYATAIKKYGSIDRSNGQNRKSNNFEVNRRPIPIVQMINTHVDFWRSAGRVKRLGVRKYKILNALCRTFFKMPLYSSGYQTDDGKAITDYNLKNGFARESEIHKDRIVYDTDNILEK